MGHLRRGLLLACCLAAFLAAIVAPVAAQSPYPSKPIRIIVPYAPGGLTDVVARLYAEQLRRSFGQGVFVENKPGASGIIAIEEMARAHPDGYTLMIGNISTNGLTPVLFAKKMKSDYERDVQIVTPLADVPVFFLATTAGVPPDNTFVETLRNAFLKAMTVPEMQEAFGRGGMVVPRQSWLDDPKRWLRDEMASWKRDIEDTGIVVED